MDPCRSLHKLSEPTARRMLLHTKWNRINSLFHFISSECKWKFTYGSKEKRERRRERERPSAADNKKSFCTNNLLPCHHNNGSTHYSWNYLPSYLRQWKRKTVIREASEWKLVRGFHTDKDSHHHHHRHHDHHKDAQFSWGAARRGLLRIQLFCLHIPSPTKHWASIP